MFSKLILAFVAASPLLCVQAQSSSASASLTSPASSVPPCVLNCSSTAAAASGCGTITNLTCVCTSTKFQAATLSCLQSNCNATDEAAATTLQSSLCGSNSTSTSAAGSSAGSATATAVSPTKSSAAYGLNTGLHMGHAIGVVTILAGVISATVL